MAGKKIKQTVIFVGLFLMASAKPASLVLLIAGISALVLCIIIGFIFPSKSITKNFSDPCIFNAVSNEFANLTLSWIGGAGLLGYIGLLVASYIPGAILNIIGYNLIYLANTREGENRYSLVVRDDKIELRRAEHEVKWLPWPHAVWTAEEYVSSLPAAEFWEHARQSRDTTSPRQLVNTIIAETQTELAAIPDRVDSHFRGLTLKMVQAELDNRVRAFQNETFAKHHKTAQSLIQKTSDRTLAKFKEDLLAGAHPLLA